MCEVSLSLSSSRDDEAIRFGRCGGSLNLREGPGCSWKEEGGALVEVLSMYISAGLAVVADTPTVVDGSSRMYEPLGLRELVCRGADARPG